MKHAFNMIWLMEILKRTFKKEPREDPITEDPKEFPIKY